MPSSLSATSEEKCIKSDLFIYGKRVDFVKLLRKHFIYINAYFFTLMCKLSVNVVEEFWIGISKWNNDSVGFSNYIHICTTSEANLGKFW